MEGISIINPFSSRYHALSDFKSLKTSQKIVTIALTIIGALATALLGTAAFFRLLVGHYCKVLKPAPGDNKNKPNQGENIPAKESAKIETENKTPVAKDALKVSSASSLPLAKASEIAQVNQNLQPEKDGNAVDAREAAAITSTSDTAPARIHDAESEPSSDADSDFTSAEELSKSLERSTTPETDTPKETLEHSEILADETKPSSPPAVDALKTDVEDSFDFSGLEDLFFIDEVAGQHQEPLASAEKIQPSLDASEDDTVELPEETALFGEVPKELDDEEFDLNQLFATQRAESLSQSLRSVFPSSATINDRDRKSEGAASFATASLPEAFQAMGACNVFASREEKERACQMAALARNEQISALGKEELDTLFPMGLRALPTPRDLGIQIPEGFKVQAFRHGKDVIVSIEVADFSGKSLTEAIAQLLLLGIDRYKSDKELIDSLTNINMKLKTLYGFELSEQEFREILLILSNRIHDATNAEKLAKMGMEAVDGAKKGAIAGAAFGGVLGAGAFLGGLAIGPVGILLAAVATLSGTLAGAGVKGVEVGIKDAINVCTDGHQKLKSALEAIDGYVAALKKKHISTSDTVITTGHGIGGFLSGIVGAINADEAYSFNGPGVEFGKDVKKILESMGMHRNIEGHVEYKSIQMEGDFIGNLGKRESGERTLYLPLTMGAVGSFPDSRYTSPFAHHGIDLMYNVLKNASLAQGLPRELSPNLPIVLYKKKKQRGPLIEEVKE